MKKLIAKLKKLLKPTKTSQKGWTTMEYVVGAIALVVVVTAVVNTFGEKLTSAIESLEIVQ